jgi:hypothetical protein
MLPGKSYRTRLQIHRKCERKRTLQHVRATKSLLPQRIELRELPEFCALMVLKSADGDIELSKVHFSISNIHSHSYLQARNAQVAFSKVQKLKPERKKEGSRLLCLLPGKPVAFEKSRFVPPLLEKINHPFAS